MEFDTVLVYALRLYRGGNGELRSAVKMDRIVLFFREQKVSRQTTPIYTTATPRQFIGSNDNKVYMSCLGRNQSSRLSIAKAVLDNDAFGPASRAVWTQKTSLVGPCRAIEMASVQYGCIVENMEDESRWQFASGHHW